MPQGLGLGLAGGGGAGGAVDSLRAVLERQFRANAQKQLMEREAAQLAEQQRQFDAMMPLRERGVANDEGNLGVRRDEFTAGRGDLEANRAADAQKQTELNAFIQSLDPSMQQGATGKAKFNLNLNDLQLKPDAHEQAVRLANLGNQHAIEQIRERERQQRLTQASRPSGDDANTKQRADAVRQMIEEGISTVEKLKSLPGMAGAVGTKGPMSLFGALPKPIAGSEAANYRAYYETLKAQLTLPNMQMMRGMGAMSDRDLAVIQGAMTALSTDMPEAAFRRELDNISRILTSAQARLAAASGATTPSRLDPATVERWEIGPNGKLRRVVK